MDEKKLLAALDEIYRKSQETTNSYEIKIFNMLYDWIAEELDNLRRFKGGDSVELARAV